ncbi:amino acid ABC transporter permease [Intestinibacillus massiliensis]|nr:amino acid ABC transporter permease [Intestinibacillus massiliensis]MCB6365344.1 amino acid ABC transporter permease [Intestinibacillus massiliensis]
MNPSVVFSSLFQSFGINCTIFFVTLLVALPLGLIVSFGAMNKWEPFRRLRHAGVASHKWGAALVCLRPVALVVKFLVWIIRGTPLMLQIIFIYYGPGLLHWGQPWNGMGVQGRVVASCVAFIINYACYFSEIFRGGIQSIPRGQQEAGLVLGMTRRQIFFKVTLLQVVKRVLPPMGNEFMTLIKDTALANIIASKEIIMMSKEFVNKGLIWPLFSTAIFFLLFCGILTLLFGWLEKKMDYFKV